MPNKLPILPGQRFGRWTVLEPGRYLAHGSKRRPAAECQCDCGTIRAAVRLDQMRGGMSLSCGCLNKELSAAMAEVNTIHGLSRHPLYRTWQSMRQRCENPRAKDYPRYGGRGITVCAGWRDVTAFITWIEANIGPRPDGMTLDRADNDGNYEPGNMRWATRKQQAANRQKVLALNS